MFLASQSLGIKICPTIYMYNLFASHIKTLPGFVKYKIPILLVKYFFTKDNFYLLLGIHYIFRLNQTHIGRVFWILVVLALSGLGLYWSIKAYNDWQDNLVLTTVNTTAYPITKIPFPAVTICSPGKINKVTHKMYEEINSILASANFLVT
jgi:hypothetical protein